jgi:peptidoglycan/LPS O-acetylase OafA/YrhL
MMPSLIQDFRYRPEIDGLRAIAVSVVVLYHAGLGAPGGFVGVDVFFVISGFLITSLIVKDLEAGTFTLAGFWERRIRRIIPALACVVLATLLAGWFMLLPNDFAELGRSAVYLGLFSANIYFWRSSGYFDGAAEQKPLLHTWSLAVEEQFYLVFPLLLVGLFAIPLLRRRGGLLSLFGLGILVSLGASAWGVILRPDATFYLLPTRAWELLLGAAVALIPVPASAGDGVFAGRIALTNNFRELLSSAALLGIILPSWHYTSDTPFPGIAALPPCLSTALFIWVTGVCSAESRVPLVARALSVRPLVFVGLISYSLYLWHWPLIAFSNYASMKPPSAGERWLLVVASVLLAALSWRLVEQPFRTRRLCKSRRSIFAMGGLAMGCILCVGLATQSSQALPQTVHARSPGVCRREVRFGVPR